MNGRVSKMLRRLVKSNNSGKREWYRFTQTERYEVIADYKYRSEEVRKQYTLRKKNAKISSSKAT